MTISCQGLDVVSPSRRRASIIGSPSRKQSTRHPVDEDILSRIQSLLLSRDGRYSPGPPFSSDQYFIRYFKAYDSISPFDFTTAKSVGNSILVEARRTISLPLLKSDVFPPGAIASMERGTVYKAKEASTRPFSSTKQINMTFDGAAPYTAPQRFPPLDSPEGPKKRFMFPRLVLQDKKKRDTSSVKSCFDITSPQIPEEGAAIHETDLICCPPCVPAEPKASRYIVSHPDSQYRDVDAKGGDLACFLTGCPPNRQDCKVHFPHQRLKRSFSASQTAKPGRERAFWKDFEADMSDFARDVAKIGFLKDLKISYPKVLSPSISSSHPSSPNDCQEQRPKHELPASRKIEEDKSGSDPDSTRAGLHIMGSSTGMSTTSSSTVLNTFPHVAQHQYSAGKMPSSRTFSSTAVTNFSLPGPRSEKQSSTIPPTSIRDIADKNALAQGGVPVMTSQRQSSSVRALDELSGIQPRGAGPPDRRENNNQVGGDRSNDNGNGSTQNRSTRTGRTSRRSLEQPPPRNDGLRSTFSNSSLENATADARPQLDDVSAPFITIRRLRDLLSNDEPYAPRLTALPPRTRNSESHLTGRIRSQTAPAGPVAQLYLGAAPKESVNMSVSRSGARSFGPELFTKTLNTLENLLSEAIVIACQAADMEDMTQIPAVPVNGLKMQSGRRKATSNESLLSSGAGDRIDSRIMSKKDYKNIKSVPSVHESLRNYSRSSDFDSSIGEEVAPQKQLETVEANRVTITNISSEAKPQDRPAGWLPTGRVSSLYPPKSLTVSEESLKIDIPHIGNASNDNGKSIQGPDSKSLKSPEQVNSLRENHKSQASYDTKIDDVKHSSTSLPLPQGIKSSICKRGHTKDEHEELRSKLVRKSVPSKRDVRGYIETFRQPPIQPRASSLALRKQTGNVQTSSKGYQRVPASALASQNMNSDYREPCSKPVITALVAAIASNQQEISQAQLTNYSHSLDGTVTDSEEIDFSAGHVSQAENAGHRGKVQGQQPGIELVDNKQNLDLPEVNVARHRKRSDNDLRGKSHVSLRGHKGFSLARSRKRQTIARDWSPARKRVSAAVACISTALVGILVGIYAGEVPAIQYYIVDFHHYTVLGNVFFFIALAIPTFFCWSLPLLHGRKPYTLSAMSIAMPLLFPQALAVGQFRSPYVSVWRVGLILSRALMGFCLGFANMNFKSTLTDLFGASLQSESPHQEIVDEFDVRRHGGGMGVWLGLWTWSAMGSIGVGFMVGAVIINSLNPAWGFYTSIVVIAAVLFLNILTPEVRRSTYRRSVAEVRIGTDVSRRLARGEVKMHMVGTGPRWWGEEFFHGVMLNQKMLRQPGFLVMSLYVAWIYAQIVLVIVLLGSLTSKYYHFKSPQVGLSVCAVPLGAMLAIPFQSASLFSRSRFRNQNRDDDTFNRKLHWSSHLIRRAIFILLLPFADLGYTLSSYGPPVPFIIPILFAGLIGFLSNLAMAECHGMLMETFDTSDLQPGMTGRPRGKSGEKTASRRTNYSSFPRVTSAFSITQGIGYLLAAVATGVGGVAERRLGAQAATGVMAGILLVLSLLLLGVLARFKEVQIIPNSKADEMTQWRIARRTSSLRRKEGDIDDDEPWRPVIIGNPTHHTRRMCLLEMGGLTRWSEIRRKNRLIDEQSLEAKHPNRVALENAKDKILEEERRVRNNIQRSLSRGSSRGSRGSRRSELEGGYLGGHREMLSQSGNGTRRKSTIQE